ncbi:MAG: NfeD family protein [Hyphomonadaceae bacterium]|nr:NfeD family protein [Hyphomonadaceae bacterium]
MTTMDLLATFLANMGPMHWLVLGLVLLIAEMASGTTYLLWPAVAAFLTALLAWLAPVGWVGEMAAFAALVIGLTWFGRPLVQRWRQEKPAQGLNERSATMIGARGVLVAFANGAGSVKVNDTVWRVVSEDALQPGETVEVADVDGVTLKVKRVA